MSEEALRAAYQAKELSENIRDSFGKMISEEIIDKILGELHQFDEAEQTNRTVCAEVANEIQQCDDLAAEINEMGESNA